MRVSYLLGLVGLAGLAAAAVGQNTTTSSAFCQVSTTSVTVTETVTAAANTVWIAINDQASQISIISSMVSVDANALTMQQEMAPINPTPSPGETTENILTETHSLTYTETIPVVGITKSSQAEAAAATTSTSNLFQFYVENGTTVWANGYAPASTDSVVFATTTVVLTPLPSTTASSAPVSLPGNLSTGFITETSFETLTSTLTGASVTPPNFTTGALPFSGGTTTLTTTQSTSTITLSASSFLTWTPYFNTSAASTWTTALSTTSSLTPISSSVTAQALGFNSSISASSTCDETTTATADKRQLGAMVTAIVDGQLVSWYNNWSGETAVNMATPSLPPYGAPSAPTGTVFIQGNATAWWTTFSSTSSFVSSSSGPSINPSFNNFPTSLATATSLVSIGSSVNPNSNMTPTSSAPTSSSSSAVMSIDTILTQFGASLVMTDSVSSSIPVVTSTATTVSPGVFAAAAAATSMQPSASAAAGQCGESGPFTLTFDDLPFFSPENNNTAPFPPIFNPYHHLYFADGFAYVPPPNDPFPPVSPPHLAVYVPQLSQNSSITGSPDAGDESAGEFGAGPRAGSSAYWFDVHSGYFACDNGSNDPKDLCVITFHGYQWDNSTQAEVEGPVEYEVFIPPCAGFKDCTLSYVDFGDIYKNLTGLSATAAVGQQPVIWFADEIALSWSDNSCQAGLARIRSH